MASLCKVMLIGNLGGNPEMRTTKSNMPVVNFSLATKEVTMKNGNKVEHTEWHRIVVWDKLAVNCHKYLTKGSSAFVEGRLQSKKYTKDGIEHTSVEIIAHQVQFLNSKKESEQQAPGPESDDQNFDYSQIPF